MAYNKIGLSYLVEDEEWSRFYQFVEDRENNRIKVYEGDAIIEESEPIGYCKGLFKDYKTCADSAEVDFSNFDDDKLCSSIEWI